MELWRISLILAFRPVSALHKTTQVPLLNLATLAVFVAWIAVACYAVAYLVSH
jgi:hypothetical protein